MKKEIEHLIGLTTGAKEEAKYLMKVKKIGEKAVQLLEEDERNLLWDYILNTTERSAEDIAEFYLCEIDTDIIEPVEKYDDEVRNLLETTKKIIKVLEDDLKKV
jgi:hypothetical protein